MRSLTALAWRSLLARPSRTVLTMVGVALGVGILFAGLVTNAGIDAAADRTARDRIGRADLRVSAFGETGLGPETLAAIEGTPGVAAVAPALERRTYLGATTGAEPSDGTEGLPASVTVLGVDPEAEARLHDWDLASGRALTSRDAPDALVSERLAVADGLTVGSTLTVFGAGDPAAYTVVGIVAGDGPLGDADGGRTVIVPIRTAQAAFDQAGLTRVDVALASGADREAVIRAFEERLLVEPYVVRTPADLAATLRASTADVSATTAMIAAIALFAGAFLILNTLSMSVVERSREVGVLRAVGATRGQVRRIVLTQAFVIGLVGSGVGLALGALLAVAIAPLVRTTSIDPDAPVISASAVVVALATGLAVTLAAALEPARRAARLTPVDALRDAQGRPGERGARVRWVAVVLVVVAAIALALWPWTGGASGTTGARRALAVYGVLLIAVVVIPFIIPALARLGGLPFLFPFGLEERLARATLLRDRGRATLTIGALTVGIALVVALASVAQHARTSATAWVEDVVPGDVIVTSIRTVGTDEGVAGDLAAVPGVARVSPIATFDLAVDGVAADGAAVVGADLAADGRLTMAAGDRVAALDALDAGGAAIVPRAMADRLGVAIDDALSVTTVEGGSIPMRIVGIAERTIPGRDGEAVLVGWDDATAHLGVAGADAFAVRFDQGAPATVADDLSTTASLAALEVVTLDRLQGAIDDALDRVFGLFDALAIVAVVVAALGIANTLTMNVMERVREIGILRAAGMTRRQVWRSVVVEAGVLGVAGVACGVVTGLVAGWLMVVLAGGPVAFATSIPWAAIMLIAVLGVALAMLAAVYPARIAARISIPRAVAYE